MKWYRNGEVHRLEQPVGKPYSLNNGPEYTTELAKLESKNRFIKQQIELLKKYTEQKGCGSRSRCSLHFNWVFYLCPKNRGQFLSLRGFYC